MTTNETALRDGLQSIIDHADGPASVMVAKRLIALLQSPSQPVVGEAANAWRYDPPPAFPRSAVPIIRIYRDKHLAEDGWAETPLYTHPQASPPPVQSEVMRHQVRMGARYLMQASAAGRLSEDEIVRVIMARIAHSQPDTQEGDHG